MRIRVGRFRRITTVQTGISPMAVLLLVVVVFTLVGGLFAVIGVAFGRADAKLKDECTVSVQAEVTDMMSNGEGLMTPVYKYEYNGVTHSAYLRSYSNKPVYSVGDTAEIMIDPDSPQQIYVPKDSVTASISKIFSIVGFSLIGVSVLVGIIVGGVLHSAANNNRKKEEPWEM